MPKFSDRSKERLKSCHVDIQRLLNELIDYVDFAVVCGHRSELQQDIAYRDGASKLEWPNSKHNKYPAQAVDIVFCNTSGTQIWEDAQACVLAGRLLHLAQWMGIGIRFGGDWDGDQDTTDQTFMDYCHFEIRK